MWRIEQIEKEPSSRCAHQSDSIGDFMYVFGGWNDENQMLNDLHRFNSVSWEWEELKLTYTNNNNNENGNNNNGNSNNNGNNNIIARNGHTMNSYKDQLIVFAGGSFSGFLNDVLIFTPDTLKWTQAQIQNPQSNPSGRSKHASCLLGDRLYIFGGGDGIRLYNDMFYLDLKEWTWNLLESTGEITPNPRWGHSMIVLPDQSHLLLFGGHSGTKRLNDLYLFNIETRQWIQIDYSKLDHNKNLNLIPHPRAGHSASIIGKHMLLYGGGDGKIINDNYLLDTETYKWWKMSNDLPPQGRCAHTSTLIKNKLIIYGGGNGLQCLKKLIILDSIDQIENLYKEFINLNQNLINNTTTNTNNNISSNGNNSPTTPSNSIKKIKNQINDLNSTLSQLSTTIELKAKKIFEDKEKEKQQSPLLKSPNINESNSNNNNINSNDNDKFKNSRLNRYEIRDITYFLNQIGMSKFVNKFIEEEIDTTVLHLLTEDHLKQLGIQSLGDRLTIIKGIRESTLFCFKGSPRISTEYDPNQIPQFIDDL